jgi:hypothetical protein
VFFHPVAGGGQAGQYVESVGGRQHIAGEVLPDDPPRPAGFGGQLPVGQHGLATLARLTAAQLAQ